MRGKNSEASAKAGPGVQLGDEPRSYSRSGAKTQSRTIPPMPAPESGISIAQWRESLVRDGYFTAVDVVGGDLGPITAIGSFMVCVGFGDAFTCVWICPPRLPWGWSDPYRLFLTPRSGAAIKYAIALAENVRKAADAEQARRERLRDASLRELGQ